MISWWVCWRKDRDMLEKRYVGEKIENDKLVGLSFV